MVGAADVSGAVIAQRAPCRWCSGLHPEPDRQCHARPSARFDGRRTVVLYVGDHDPSGLDMDRDLADRLRRLGADVELERLALTAAQVDEYRLPPQPTKSGDSRAFGYSRDHAGSWELDALPADALAGLVSDAIAARQPSDLAARRAADDTARARIREVAGLVR